MKGKPQTEETFTKRVSDKRICKELLQLDNKKATQWAKDITRHFTKEDPRMANKPVKRSSASLVTRETQMKTAGEQHYEPARAAHDVALPSVPREEDTPPSFCKTAGSCLIESNIHLGFQTLLPGLCPREVEKCPRQGLYLNSE